MNTERANININKGANLKKIGIDDDENQNTVLELVSQTGKHVTAISNVKNVTTAELKEHLKTHFDLTLKHYNDLLDSDNHKQWVKFRGLLIAELKEYFRVFCLNLTSTYSPDFSRAVATFQSQVNAEIESRCIPRKNLENLLSRIKEIVLQQFRDLVPEIEQLKSRLDEETMLFISDNNKHLGVLYERFNLILPELLEVFEEGVEFLSDDNDQNISDQKLENIFQKCKTKVLKKMSKAFTFDGQEIKNMFEDRIDQILSDHFAEKTKTAKSKQQKKFTEADIIVKNAIDSYAKSMSEMFEKTSDDRNIEMTHKETVKDLEILINDKIYDILPEKAIEMREAAKLEMENKFQQMKTQRLVQEQKFLERWRAELNSVCDVFQNKLSELLKSETLLDMDEMLEKRNYLINEVISKSNWYLDKKSQKKDLLSSFYDAAKQQMQDLSIPMLQTHERKLMDVFEYQKVVMNDCLEEHNIKIKDLLTGQLDEAVVRAKSEGLRTLQRFQIRINMRPMIIGAHVKSTSDLKSSISKIEVEFEKLVKDRQLMVNVEMSQLVTDAVIDYEHLMSAFSIAANYGKDKIGQIHVNLKNRAKHNMLKALAKYSQNTQEQQRDFETIIEKRYNDIKVAFDKQQTEWNKKLESCNQKAMVSYVQLWNNSIAFVLNEEELQKLHGDMKEEAIATWEEAFPIHYFGDILLPERRKFVKKLDNHFVTNIIPSWQQINLDIDRDYKAAVEGVVKIYEQKLTSMFNEYNYVTNDMILSGHDKYSKEAERSISKIERPKNVSKETYDELLPSRLVNTLECFKIQNTQKKLYIESDISNKIHQIKEVIRREAFDNNILPGISTLFDQYKARIETLVRQFKTPTICREELHSFAKEKLKAILEDVQKEWNKTEPDANLLQISINKAIEEYEKEMNNRTNKKGDVFRSSTMASHHKDSLGIVQKKFQENVRQTSTAKEKFNQAIGEKFKWFEDQNDLRAAESIDAAVGIDLGTTYSAISIYRGEQIEMIPDRGTSSITVPSYVYYESVTKTVVGDAAKHQSGIYPRETIYDSKRLIGRKFDDEHTTKDMTHWPFKVVRDPDQSRNAANIEVHGKTIYPEQVSGEILKHLKNNAEHYLGREVKDVVITVPAYFNDSQKRATKAAAAFANMNVLEIINEPTSAAIAYSLHYTDGKSRNILVFDLGGGTFDVSVLTTQKCNIVVKAVDGDNHLGGEDFDTNMVDFCINKFRQDTGIDIPKNDSSSTLKGSAIARRRIQKSCEEAKKSLSTSDKTRVTLDHIVQGTHMDIEVTVEDFNEMNKLMFEKCIQIVKNTIDASNLTKEQITDVVLVGGSSRIPRVQKLLTDFFGGKSLIMTLNPDEVVAQGAAYRAAMISGSRSIKLAGMKFQDVNPLSLGVEVIGKKFSIIIPKNTSLPAKRTETYVTTVNYQTKILFSIYEGEDNLVKNNNLLGEFTLLNIPPKERGEEPVEVTIECDGEGLIHVTAKVLSNDSSKEIKIHSKTGGLTEEAIKTAMARSRFDDTPIPRTRTHRKHQ